MGDTGGMLTGRFEQALQFSLQLHARQLRKGSKIPYIAHLLGVTALVLEDGGGEDEAIAALLHDAAEDQGGLETLEEIRKRFGPVISGIVEGCSDTLETPKPPWRERKERYLEHLHIADPGVRRVSRADKLHNARSILANLRTIGPQTWQRFNGGKEGTLWYYRSLVDVFQGEEPSYVTDELVRVVAQIEELAKLET